MSQHVEPLSARGIELRIEPFFDRVAFARLYTPGGVILKALDLARLTPVLRRRLRSAKHCDVVMVHREMWPLVVGWPLAILRDVQPKWVFDSDDGAFIPNVTDANHHFVRFKSHGSVPAIVAGARAVAAGNRSLATWARRQRAGQPAESVEVIPTAIDSDRWTPAPSTDDRTIRLLWIGSPGTLRYLEAWGPVLSRLGERHRALELRLSSGRLKLPGLHRISHPWSAETECSIAQHCNVGPLPLADGDWERAKCELKLLLYMALGLPAVALHAGVHAEMIPPGVDGELVAGDAELESILERLIPDATRRETRGDAVAPKLEQLLQRAAESA